MKICPVCKGRGFKQVMQNYGGIKTVSEHVCAKVDLEKCKFDSCHFCNGKKKVTAEKYEELQKIKRILAFWKKRSGI